MVGEYEVTLSDGRPLGRCGCELVLHEDGIARGSLVIPSDLVEWMLVKGQGFALTTDDPNNSTITCTLVYWSRSEHGAVAIFHGVSE